MLFDASSSRGWPLYQLGAFTSCWLPVQFGQWKHQFDQWKHRDEIGGLEKRNARVFCSASETLAAAVSCCDCTTVFTERSTCLNPALPNTGFSWGSRNSVTIAKWVRGTKSKVSSFKHSADLLSWRILVRISYSREVNVILSSSLFLALAFALWERLSVHTGNPRDGREKVKQWAQCVEEAVHESIWKLLAHSQ